MATVNLGSIKFKWKGTYAGGTAYTIDDVVSYNGSSYICIQASTGNLPTDTTYFEQMSSAGTNGTNGTDLTTTLTTQGDILYRDGSGLQRLPKGTAGQVLQMNSGATAPEYGTVSSDFVKIANGSVSGSATSLSIDGYYSSTYKNYKLIFENIQSNGSRTDMRVNFGGSANTTSNYREAMDGVQNAAGNLSTAQISVWDGDKFNMTNWGATNSYGDIINLDIFDPQSTTFPKRFQWVTSTFHGSEIHILTAQGIFNANSSTASTGVTFLSSSNNITTGDWYLYGMKS